MERKYKYTGYVFLAILPLLYAGFYKTYFEHFPHFSNQIQYFDHVHAVIAGMWITLLIVQPILIARRKNHLHKVFGIASYFVFCLLLLSFVPEIIKVIKRGALRDLFFPVADSVVLSALYFLAVYHRRNITKHMRYMIAATFVFFGPTVGRIGPSLLNWSGVFTQNIQYTIIYCLLIGLIVYDSVNKKKSGLNMKKSKPYFIATGFFALHQLVFYLMFL